MPRTAYGGTPTAASERKKSNKANAPVSSLEQQPKTKKARADSVSSRVGKENGGSADSAEADLLQRVLSLLQQPAAAAALTALPTTDTAAAAAAAAQAALAEASFWKGQYEALQELRETAPEQRLRELRASLDSQVGAMEALAAEVREGMAAQPSTRLPRPDDVEDGEEGAAVANQDVASPAAAAEEDEEESEPVDENATEGDADGVIEELESKLDEKRELLRVYQRLTGVVLALGDEHDDSHTVQCTVINHIHKRVVKFDLLLPKGDSAAAGSSCQLPDATFVPVANTALLPVNLRDGAVRFNGSQLPVLTQRVLKALYAPDPAARADAATPNTATRDAPSA